MQLLKLHANFLCLFTKKPWPSTSSTFLLEFSTFFSSKHLFFISVIILSQSSSVLSAAFLCLFYEKYCSDNSYRFYLQYAKINFKKKVQDQKIDYYRALKKGSGGITKLAACKLNGSKHPVTASNDNSRGLGGELKLPLVEWP